MIEKTPTAVLKAVDRVLERCAPKLAWKWRYAIFLEQLMREVGRSNEPGWRVTVGG